MFTTNFGYAYGNPSCTGLIRCEASDFKVFELSDIEHSGAGEHVFVKIRKTNANTGWVAGQLAKFAGIAPKDVGFAGRKDRRAVTEQWFSCYLPGTTELDWQALAIEGVELLEVTRHNKKLRKGDAQGNLFELTIRELSEPAALGKRLEIIRDSGIPNYFGEQRFGREHKNLEFAHKILAKRKPIKQNRDIYLSAARSYMFNHYLSNQLAEVGWSEISAVEEGPLYGMSRDPRPGEDIMPPECEKWCAGLQALRVKTGSRNLKVKAKNLQWRLAGQTLQLTFSLPAGCFATSLLRELLDYSDGSRQAESALRKEAQTKQEKEVVA